MQALIQLQLEITDLTYIIDVTAVDVYYAYDDDYGLYKRSLQAWINKKGKASHLYAVIIITRVGLGVPLSRLSQRGAI